MNVLTTSIFNATILDPITKWCYSVPDAFVSTRTGIAVRFHQYSSKGFRALASVNISEYRRKLAASMKLELGLNSRDSELVTAGMNSAFSGSAGIRSFMNSETKTDSAQMRFIQSTLQIVTQTPLPTSEVISLKI
jgi:hypothetical protein